MTEGWEAYYMILLLASRLQWRWQWAWWDHCALCCRFWIAACSTWWNLCYRRNILRYHQYERGDVQKQLSLDVKHMKHCWRWRSWRCMGRVNNIFTQVWLALWWAEARRSVLGMFDGQSFVAAYIQYAQLGTRILLVTTNDIWDSEWRQWLHYHKK